MLATQKNKKTEKIKLRSILLVTFALGGLVLGILTMNSRTALNMTERQGQMIHAVMEIQYEITRFHLWLEEILAGDKTLSKDEVWQYLETAKSYAHAILDGGDIHEGYVPASNSPELRKYVKETLRKLDQLDSLARLRTRNLKESMAGKPIDAEFDSLYNEVLALVEKTENTLLGIIEAQKKDYTAYAFIMGLIILLATILCAFLFYRYEHQRVKNLQQVKESETRQRVIMDNMLDGVITINEQGIINTVNKAAEMLFAYKADEMIGQNVSLIVPEPHARMHDSYLSNYHNGGEAKVVGIGRTVEGLRKNGSTFPMELSVSEVELDGVRTYTAILRDISERTYAEKRLKQFKDTLDQTLDCVFMFDARELRFFYVNEGALKQVGYSREEMLALHPFDIKPEFSETKFREMIKPMLNGELVSLNFETIHQHKNGQTVPVEIFMQYVTPKNGPARFVAIVRDIKERKQAAAALRQASILYEKIISESPIGMAVYDSDGQCLAANDSVAEMVGATKEQVLSQNYNHIESWKKSGLLALARKAISSDSKEQMEISVQTTFGKTVYFDFRVVPFQVGHKTHLLLMADDITERKTRDEELDKSTQRLNKAQSLAKVGSWELDLEKDALLWSDEIFNIFELDKKKFSASYDAFLQAIHPEDQDMVNKAYSDSLINRKPYGITHRIIMGDGSIKYVNEICESFFNDDGKPVRSVGTIQDVTEIKKVERDIEQGRARFEAMFESLSDAIVYAGPDRKIQMANSATFQMFGYDESELFGNETKMLYASPDDFKVQGKKRYNPDAAGKVKATPYIITYKRKDGREFQGETLGMPVKSSDGEVLGYLGIIRDITERTQVDAVLRSLAAGDSSLKFETYMEELLERLTEVYGCHYAFIGELQADGKHVQTLAVRAGGKQVDNFEYALNGTPCQDILDEKETLIPKNAQSLYSEDQMLVDMGVESYFGTRLLAADGTILGLISIMDTKPLALDEWTEPVLDVFAARMSLELERNLATKELQQHRDHLEELVRARSADLILAREEAENASRAKSEFLSSMSHELRTPMNAILGFGQMLELDADGFNKTQRENVGEILGAGNHLMELINEVLDLARIESGKMEVSIEEVHIDDVLNQCLNLIKPQAKRLNIQVTNHASGHDHIVKADYTRLKQVFLNILSNAVKYNRDNGTVILDSEIINNQRLRIHITDSGQGLSKAEISKLFTSFERLNKKSNIEGTGIGLVITKHLTELMGGSIAVESTPGKGSTFWVELNLA